MPGCVPTVVDCWSFISLSTFMRRSSSSTGIFSTSALPATGPVTSTPGVCGTLLPGRRGEGNVSCGPRLSDWYRTDDLRRDDDQQFVVLLGQGSRLKQFAEQRNACQ